MKRVLIRSVKWLVAAVILAGAGYLVYSKFFAAKEQNYAFRSTPLERGTITVAITASGTVEPEELVDVGAQVAGQILEFGVDENGNQVDYTSPVKEGSVLARIDDALYDAEVKQNEARVSQAQAAIVSAEADVLQQKAILELAEVNWKRAQSLYKSKVMSEADHDNSKSSYDTAVAAMAVAQAKIEQAKAELDSAQAQYNYSLRNLGYCVITSPVDGIIIDRRVNIGQTVVSSMSAPSLFLIAKDLRKMQVWVSVNEADIGRIAPGMPVEFTVDAFPNEQFAGTVGKIRYNASLSSNVVTYIVEVNTDNSDLKLLPYLTANVSFLEARRENTLLTPAAALRFEPPAALVSEADRQYLADSDAPVISPTNRTSGVLWVADPATRTLVARPVKLGVYDGVFYEVLEGASEGDVVVTGMETGAAAVQAGETNPFLPTPPRRR